MGCSISSGLGVEVVHHLSHYPRRGHIPCCFDSSDASPGSYGTSGEELRSSTALVGKRESIWSTCSRYLCFGRRYADTLRGSRCRDSIQYLKKEHRHGRQNTRNATAVRISELAGFLFAVSWEMYMCASSILQPRSHCFLYEHNDWNYRERLLPLRYSQ